jgi:predicted RNA-binding protein with PUA-like domain
MNSWLLKSEPTVYSYASLEADGRTVWNGVANPLALQHLRSMKKGDRAIFYHTGKDKAAVGIVSIASDPYPDPDADDPKAVVVDVKAVRRLPRPVPLDAIKREKRLQDSPLVRFGRLSVVPLTPEQWTVLLQLGGG